MKKLVFIAFLTGFSVSAQASEYREECKQMIDLTFEAAEVMPEMKTQLGMDKETMTKVSLDAWSQMSEAERTASISGCKAGVAQMKQIIEAAKAQKK